MKKDNLSEFSRELGISHLLKGAYIIKMQSGARVIARKFIVY
jgi:hypothetical protein